jgi:outer membrane lipoprotein-sorting protein
MSMLMSVLLWGAVALAEEPTTTSGDKPTIEELLDDTDDVARGSSSEAVMDMQVKTDRYERSMKMRALSKGEENSLIVILEPAKDAGVATLKNGDNLYNYMPKVDRTMKIPAGMMSGAWMGSHFSNDDLVKGSRMREDYTYTLTHEPGQPGEPADAWVIELVPKPDAPVVWGKVIVTIGSDRVPRAIDYFDERGDKIRTMEFTDVQDIDGRKVPMTMKLVPHDKPGEFTKMHYESLKFDVPLDDNAFTLQALKR